MNGTRRMPVVVTGAAGFLGGETLRLLRARNYDVTGTARTAKDGLLACDLSDPGALWRLLEEIAPAAVVNCAVVADFGTGVLARQYPVNVLAPGAIANWCARHGAYLVQASTIAVHGSATARAGPGAPVAPDSDYGRSKLLAENLIEASGCAAAVIRFGGLFGIRGPDHLGLNRALRAARDGTPPTVFGEGRARRNYLHVADAAAMIAFCLRHRLARLLWAGGRETLSIAEMLEAVCEVFLPGTVPRRADGTEAGDQIVETSPELPPGRSLREALRAERDGGPQ